MICKDSVLKWFKGLSSHHRIDLMCSLLNKCLPFELRFLGTCLEDLGKQDFNQMKDFVVKANNVTELSEFQVQCIISDTSTRQKLALYVCLLHSLNTACSTLIYKCLYGIDINQVVTKAKNSDEKILEELLTIYTVAVNHPAFSFEQRSNLGSLLLRLRQEEGRLQAEKLAESVNADFHLTISDSSDGLRNMINSEIPPPSIPAGLGYAASMPGNSASNLIQVYPSFPGQPLTHQVYYPFVNYQPVLSETLTPADMPPPYPPSPLISHHSSPSQSAQHSRTNSPNRKCNFPRGEQNDQQLKPGSRSAYNVEHSFPKVVYPDRGEGAFPDTIPTSDNEIRGLSDKVAELTTEDVIRSAVVSLNGITAPPVRSSLPATPAHQRPVHHAPYDPEISSHTVVYSRGIESSLLTPPTGPPPPPPPPVFSRPSAHFTPRYNYSTDNYKPKPMNQNFEETRNGSSSSGSDASSTSHSPPVTPATVHQNWEKGYDGEETLSLARPRLGFGRGRGRPNTQGIQTLPRDRFPGSSNLRRDCREGPRSAPPTPHEEKKTYHMPPPGNEVAGPTSAPKPPLTHDIMPGGIAFPGPMLHPPFTTAPPCFQPFHHTYIRSPYSYPNGDMLYTYQPQPQPPFLPAPLVSYSSTVPPPKIACYNCSQNHHPNDCKEPTMEEYSSKDDKMSSVESASMSSSDVSEKGPIDFGVKAVSLKSQAEANRLLQSGGPLRPLPSPSISRQSSGYQAQHIPLPSLGNVTQTKTVSFNKVTSGSGQAVGNMSSGTAITAKPPLSTSAVTSTTSLHGSTTTYLLPRGAAQQVQGPRASTTMGRASMTLQPVSSVQTLVRTQSPSSSQSGPVNHVRAPSPAGQPRTVVTARSTISAGKPTQTRSEVARPIVLPSTPNRPLTLTPTTQLHITTDNKTMKVPMGSVTQVLRPTLCSAFVGQNQTTILQRGDGVTLQGASPTTVLTTPVRLTPPLTPLLTTQRVAVSVGTRLTMQQHVTVTGSIPSAPRLPSPGIPNRNTIPSSGPSNASKMGVQPVGSNTIITTGRVAYATGQVVTGAAPLTRVAPQAAISSASNKPSSTPTMVTTSSRTPLANHLTGHVGGKPRFVRPQTGPPAAASSGLLVHSQLVVSSGNHGTTVRPALVTSTGTKVINQSLAGSIHLAAAPAVGKAPISIASPATNQLTPVISKPEVFKQMTPISMSRVVPPPKSYPLSPVQSSASSIGSSEGDQQHLTTQPQSTTVFIPGTQRTNITAGVVTTQSSLADRPGSTPTLNTYTLPSGTSYYYEAPSGYQLATDAPLVARPLSPDAPLVSRQLATEGPLIARPYTPGLIATSQAMRFNPVMIVDSASSASLPIVTTTGDTPNTSGNDPTTPAKLTSSPRPSILRKRDNEGNVGSKVVKNLAAALSGASSRSRTPSPPTSLHLETNQTNTDVGPSSNGSTTISATSSPGPEETPDPDRPTEMSPRKKPRKQLLNEATNDSIDMEFISEDKLKKEKEGASETNVDGDDDKVFVVKRPTSVSLLRQYKHNWKARNNHFQRYSDVKVREERRPSVTELANQRQIVQRVKGWKIYHLSTQFEDLSEMESCVLDRLSTIFKAMDNNLGKEFEKDVNRVNELIMGNIQRSKVIRDQMTEAKLQMMKGFDHKVHVSEIISRCASKRNFKKRDKY